MLLRRMDRIALLKENQGLAHCLMSGVFIIRCLSGHDGQSLPRVVRVQGPRLDGVLDGFKARSIVASVALHRLNWFTNIRHAYYVLWCLKMFCLSVL